MKGYLESLKRIDELVHDHDVFLNKNSGDIDLHISDSDFKNRCQICYSKIAEWMKNIS
jgi:hypothetical protein